MTKNQEPETQVSDHPLHNRNELDMSEYQSFAKNTAIYPRVYTEDQVRRIITFVGYRGGAIATSHPIEFTDELVSSALSMYETDFSRLVYPILGLAGEAGELANKLKKVARDGKGMQSDEQSAAITDELGDVQWYVAAVATGLNADLGLIAHDNIEKLYSRKARGVIGGSGDTR